MARFESNICPECKSPDVVNGGGCDVCLNCGFNACPVG